MANKYRIYKYNLYDPLKQPVGWLLWNQDWFVSEDKISPQDVFTLSECYEQVARWSLYYFEQGEPYRCSFVGVQE